MIILNKNNEGEYENQHRSCRGAKTIYIRNLFYFSVKMFKFCYIASIVCLIVKIPEWFIKGCLKKRNKWCQSKLDRNTFIIKGD